MFIRVNLWLKNSSVFTSAREQSARANLTDKTVTVDLHGLMVLRELMVNFSNNKEKPNKKRNSNALIVQYQCAFQRGIGADKLKIGEKSA